jgi:hypothetical protein
VLVRPALDASSRLEPGTVTRVAREEESLDPCDGHPEISPVTSRTSRTSSTFIARRSREFLVALPLAHSEEMVFEETNEFPLRTGPDVRRDETAVEEASDKCRMVGGKQPPTSMRQAQTV